MTRQIRVELLGSFRLRIGDQELTAADFVRPAARELVQFLALAPGRQRHQEQIADALWPDAAFETAKRRLYKATSIARRALGSPGAIVARSGTLTLLPDDHVTVDLHEVSDVDRSDSDAVTSALERFRGDALTDLMYAEWAGDIRREYGEHRRALLRTAGRWRTLIELDPIDEEAHVALMRDALDQGDRAGAIRRYDQLVDVLAAELGVRPGPAAVALHQAAVAHGLDDISEQADPGVVSSETRTGRPVVIDDTSIGRGDEIKTLVEALETHRLINIVGPGGVGKTHLARHAAVVAEAAFPDGVWLAELGNLGQPEDVVQELLHAVGGSRHSDVDEFESLARTLRNSTTLLVVDNCEHLLDSAADLITSLLDSCPELRVLATSRVPFELRSELVVPVGPLHRSSAIDLFEREVHRRGGELGRSDDERVQRICERLDDLPLAIQLAASRARRLGVATVEDRLDTRLDLFRADRDPSDGPAHHRTLRAAIAWSYDSLSDSERSVLRDLSMFANRFTVSGAEFVAARPEHESGEILDHIDALVRQSLLVGPEQIGTEPTFRLLESIRLFAREAGDEQPVGDDAGLAANRHLDYVIAASESASLRMRDDTEVALRRHGAGWDDTRRAWQHAIATGRRVEAIHLLAAVAPVVVIWLRFEFGDWCQQTFGPSDGVDRDRMGEMVAAGASPRAVASVLGAWAFLIAERGDLVGGREVANVGHQMDPTESMAMYALGWIGRVDGTDDEGAGWFERVADDLTGDTGTIRGGALSHLVAIDEGRGERAKRSMARLEVLAASGQPPYVGTAAAARAVTATGDGDLEGARDHFAHAISVADRHDNKMLATAARSGVALCSVLMGDREHALTATREAIRWPFERGIWRGIGSPLSLAAAILAEYDETRAATMVLSAVTHSNFAYALAEVRTNTRARLETMVPSDFVGWWELGADLSTRDAAVLALAAIDGLGPIN